jgi:hypothetical protein
MAVAVDSFVLNNTALRSNNVQTVDVPATVDAGDLLIIVVGCDYNQSAADGIFTIASGWNKIGEVGSATSDAYVGAFWRLSNGTEGGTTVTIDSSATGTSNDYWSACIRVLGNKQVLPIGVIGNGVDESTGTNHTIPSVTTTYPNAFAIAVWSGDGADLDPVSLGTSWVKIIEAGTNTTSTSSVSGGVATLDMDGTPTDTPTGDLVVTNASGSSDGHAGFMFTIRPLDIPTEIRETLKQSDGSNYPDGTVVRLYNSAGDLYITGAVGAISGNRPTYGTGITSNAGEVVFRSYEGDTSSYHLVVDPSTDTDGLVTNPITPVQLQ